MVSLINISIDSPLNISWWVVKNVLYGTYCLSYYLIYGNKKTQTNEEILLLELKKEISELDKKIEMCNSHKNTETDFILLN